jgi:hypothetical protein
VYFSAVEFEADFFNRIGQKPPVGSGGFRLASVIQNWLIGKSQRIERVYEIRGDSVRRNTRFLVHVEASGVKAMANDVMPSKHKAQLRFLSMTQIKFLLSAAETLASDYDLVSVARKP